MPQCGPTASAITVSLNLDTRRAEREEFRTARLDRENLRRAAIGLEPLDDASQLEDTETPDIVLNEAADVVADMAVIAGVTPAPASAAIQ